MISLYIGGARRKITMKAQFHCILINKVVFSLYIYFSPPLNPTKTQYHVGKYPCENAIPL